MALGHLHRPQHLAGPAPIHYCGSPLQLDFGEHEQRKQVNLVHVEPGAPAAVDPLPLSAGRPLRTVTGTLDELRAEVDDEAWLRVRVNEARRPDLADDVRNLLGDRVVDVQIAAPAASGDDEPRPRRTGRDPIELFTDYLGMVGDSSEIQVPE